MDFVALGIIIIVMNSITIGMDVNDKSHDMQFDDYIVPALMIIIGIINVVQGFISFRFSNIGIWWDIRSSRNSM